MAIGTEMAAARKRMNLTQEDLGMGINYSRESVAKFEAGTRNIPKGIYREVAQTIDDPEYYFLTQEEATGHVSIPYFNGDFVDHHPSSMKHLVQIETNEALNHLEKACWYKPIHNRTDTEKEEMRKVLRELLDAAASMINLVAVICREYDFSMKDVFKEWRVSLKIRRFRK